MKKKTSNLVVIFLSAFITSFVSRYLTDSIINLKDLSFYMDFLFFLAIYLVIYFPLNYVFEKFVVKSTSDNQQNSKAE